MCRAFASVLIAFAATAFAAQSDTLPDPLAGTVLERLASSDDPACVVVALVESTTRYAFGCTRDAASVALDEHSLFEIGSISKAFTGILLADMVLKGEVALDDPASKHSRPGARLPTRGGREITLRDLATHTSGLPRMPPGFAPADRTDPYAGFDADKLYEALARTELQSEPGATFLYSNFGFMWLSEMLSRMGGGTYEEVLRKRVLQPLGLNETVVTMDEAQRKRFADGHDPSGAPMPHWNGNEMLAGSGALRSSAADMAKFAAAVAGARDTPLKAAIDLAVRPDRFAGANMIGLAWHLMDTRNGRALAWHNGGTAGFASMLAVDRDAHRAAVVLVNASSRFDDLALHLMDPSYPLRGRHVAVGLDLPGFSDQP